MDRRRIRIIKEYGKFSKILVTGPQRSGTRIGAKIIAYETGHTYIDENEFEINNCLLFKEMLSKHNVVLQCPGMCYNIHSYSDEDTLIILMVRAIADIIESEERIGWRTGPYSEYENYGIRRKVAKYYRGRNLKPISEIKYKFWNDYQKERIKHYVELDYEFLNSHPLWVSKKERNNWNASQTR